MHTTRSLEIFTGFSPFVMGAPPQVVQERGHVPARWAGSSLTAVRAATKSQCTMIDLKLLRESADEVIARVIEFRRAVFERSCHCPAVVEDRE